MSIRGLLFAVILTLPAAAGAADISVIGLFRDKAVIVVDGGKPRTMSIGETSPEGVRLVSANSEGAVIEYGGRRRSIAPGESSRVSSMATGSGPARVTLMADSRGHFITTGTVNGTSVQFIVDTGASAISLSAAEARRLGIRYQNGRRSATQTANGVVPVYVVSLDTVRIGDITANNVEAVVIEGDAMPVALLGMSFLNRVEMKREGVTMTLTRRY